MTKNLIFTATYNEADNISKYINEVFKYSKNSYLLIIDDNSPDKTYQIIKEHQKKNKKIFCIKRKNKMGLDTAHKLGYEFALKNKFDKLITMDADLSHNPKEIPIILKYLEKKDFVIGSRYIFGAENKMNFIRFILSYIANKLIKFTLKTKINEHTTSYRGFNLKKIKNFRLNEVKGKGYSFFMETIYLLKKKNITIHEIPIVFEDRKYGKSKIPKIEMFRTFKNLIFLFFKD